MVAIIRHRIEMEMQTAKERERAINRAKTVWGIF
jgi:hypothetical protein